MSKQADQTLAMLAAASGAMKWLRLENSYAKVEVKTAIQNMEATIHDAIRDWPRFINRQWVEARWLEFAEEIDSPDRTENYEAIEMVLICDRIVTDLQDLYRFGTSHELVARIVPYVKILTDHADREGDNFVAYDRVAVLMDKLYEIVGVEDRAFA